MRKGSAWWHDEVSVAVAEKRNVVIMERLDVV